ncbi:hypothetical protein AVEN_244629-1 [Araneus ventricosus]|uniref:Transposable element Tc3 transposase n=1 Tax=Araneus ventricosus TaxID=182803 RepID=A0A4Y2MEN8_ARAVE|nr:hypothetical protein AVEN_244629-1 [Araneus ventricosus]
MTYSTVRQVRRRILCYFPYEFQSVHQLSDGEAEVRETFALQFLARMAVNEAWSWNILWSDEAHFFLNCQLNTHNCIWPIENPHAIHQVFLHPAKVTVWDGFTAKLVIRPYFLTVDSNRVCNLLRYSKRTPG